MVSSEWAEAQSSTVPDWSEPGCPSLTSGTGGGMLNWPRRKNGLGRLELLGPRYTLGACNDPGWDTKGLGWVWGWEIGRLAFTDCALGCEIGRLAFEACAIGVTPETPPTDLPRVRLLIIWLDSPESVESCLRFPLGRVGGGGRIRSSLRTKKRDFNLPLIPVQRLMALSRSACWSRCLKPRTASTYVRNRVPLSFVPTLLKTTF